MATILSAIVAGVAVLLAGSLPWFLLASANQRVGLAIPWAIVPMVAYLAAYWTFIRGDWGPDETVVWRRERLRANPLSVNVWTASLMAGLLGFGALLAFITLFARLMLVPASAPIVFPAGMPFVTGFLLLVMASIVAGVTEEAAFRGYMQGPIEKRYGLAAAVLVSGIVFGLLHFPNHPGDVLVMLPYYVGVSAVYGGLTWAADSILPALVLHAGGDVWSLGRLWLTGRPEWQLSPAPTPLVWDTGIDAAFLITAGVVVVLAGATAWAYVAVRRLASGNVPAMGGVEA